MQIRNEVSVHLEFDGWTSNDIDKINAYRGNKLWENGKIKTTETIFKNLASAGNHVTLVANWKDEEVTLPILEKENYNCTWNTKSDGTGGSYISSGIYTISGNDIYTEIDNTEDSTCGNQKYNNIITLYAICEKMEDEIIEKKDNGLLYVLCIVCGGLLAAVVGAVYYYLKKRKNVNDV